MKKPSHLNNNMLFFDCLCDYKKSICFNFLTIFIIIILTLVCIPVTQSKLTILTSPITIKYDYFNSLSQISLRFHPVSKLLKQDIIFISFSQQLQSSPSNIKFNLYNQFNKEYMNGQFNYIIDIDILMFNMNGYKAGENSSYVMKISQNNWYLAANQIEQEWLTLKLHFMTDLLHLFDNGLAYVNIVFISEYNDKHIHYQSNICEYLYFSSLQPIAPAQLINISIANPIYGITSSQRSLNTRPGIIYPIYLQLIPLIQYSNTIINLQFTQLSLLNLTNNITSLPSNDFMFQGTCGFICIMGIKCMIYSKCKVINYNLIQITISMLEKLIIGEKYVLKLSLLNPPYLAQTNLILWVDQIGMEKDTANIVGTLNTRTINIKQDQLRLFWRIPEINVYNDMKLGIFLDGGINTIEVGFMIDDYSPFGELLDIYVYIGSKQLILQSINHNLPAVNTTIFYEYSIETGYLILGKVSALSRINYRYWVSYRCKYTQVDYLAGNLNLIGTVDIKLNKIQYQSQLLFIVLNVNRVKNVVNYTDYHDWNGWNNVAIGKKNYDTHVISAVDNGLENGTAQGIRAYMNENTTVGIDPSIRNQQLIFFMKTIQSQISNSTITDQIYEFRLYYNPNIFTSISPKGIQIISYNPMNSSWSVRSNDCYFDQSNHSITNTSINQIYMCQKYDDHVYNDEWNQYQKYNKLINNQSNGKYGYYRFMCGDSEDGSEELQCVTPPCTSQCNLFKGFNTGLGSSGVAAIRNVTFISNYQSPIKANDKNLDFVVAFYHAGQFVSATMINGYTLKRQPLKQLTVKLVNTYHDSIKYNLGDTIPTMLKISGKLTYTQSTSLNYPDRIKLFLPPFSTKFNDFLITSSNNPYKISPSDNQIGCTYTCRFNQSYLKLFNNNNKITQNWLTMNVLTVQNMPILTNKFTLLIPIQLIQNVLSVYVGFEAKGMITGVYRVGGSAVSQLINGQLKYFFTSSTYSLQWNLQSPWTISSIYTLTPKIDLSSTIYTSTATNISLSSSNLALYQSPYFTLSIKKINIISAYSTNILIGNTILNRSCQKLFYSYQNEPIQTILCQMYSNSNTSTNEIHIEYPVYDDQNWLGVGVPYDQLFYYAYSGDITGKMEGYNYEQGNKIKEGICYTSKATEYNVGEVGRQLEVYRFKIDPIVMSLETFSKIQLLLQMPINISAAQCLVKQTIFNSVLNCAVISKSLNITTFQLSLPVSSTIQVKLLTFQLHINCYQIGPVVVPVNTLYNIQLRLPHSNSNNIKTIYGINFFYFSTFYSCFNFFNVLNSAYSNFSKIQSHFMNAVGIGLNSEIKFNITFDRQKGDLIPGHLIQLQFNSQLQVNQETYCDIVDFRHMFGKRQWIVNKYVFYIDQILRGFVLSIQQIECSNLILRGMSPTVMVRVVDVVAGNKVILLSNLYPLTFTLPYNIANILTTSTMSTTISTKKYSSFGFNSQETFVFSSISVIGLVQGYIDLSQFSLDQRLLRCRILSAVDNISQQEIFCKKSSKLLRKQSRSNIIYFKSYFSLSTSSISLTIYPIYQQDILTPSTIRFLLLNMINNISYSTFLLDRQALTINKQPILIKKYNLIPVMINRTIIVDIVKNITTEEMIDIKFNLVIEYMMPINNTDKLYVKVPESVYFMTIRSVILNCMVNYTNKVTNIMTSTNLPCILVQKDLIQVDYSSYFQTFNTLYSLTISSFKPNYLFKLSDPQYFWLQLYLINPSTLSINYISIIDQQPFISPQQIMDVLQFYKDYLGYKYLVWNNVGQNNDDYNIHKIYYGYYKQNGLQLKVNDNSKFRQSFRLIDNMNYPLNIFTCDMGYYQCKIQLALTNNTISITDTFQQLNFLNPSYFNYYYQPYPIYVQLSYEPCIITIPFFIYTIFHGGLTLPIILNFTHCRPVDMLSLVINFGNISQIILEDSLSEINVTYENPIAVVVIKNVGVDVGLKSYMLGLSLQGQYSSSFIIPNNVTIMKIAQNQSSIQAKQPQPVQIHSQSALLQVQCNQPSTIYWTVGVYPQTLGIQAQDIQTRLLDGQIGLRVYEYDELNYGDVQYGLNYSDKANIWTRVWFDKLRGNTTYSFKYFCQSIKGLYSGGKIYTFTTLPSTFTFIKLTLGFITPLLYHQQNLYACTIAQSLIIPYSDVITSTSSNCVNNHLIYYKGYDLQVYDEMVLNRGIDNMVKSMYYEIFYINTDKQKAGNIMMYTKDKIKGHKNILMNKLAIFEFYMIQQTQPDLVNPVFSGPAQFTTYTNSLQIYLPINYQNSLIIVGLISISFTPKTMAVPQPYMIKQGKFSDMAQFDQVYMNYTTKSMKFKFDNLKQNQNYSIFYFVTVDDARINARHSQVKYVNLMTKPMLWVDMWDQLIGKVGFFIGLVVVIVIL